MTMAVGAAVKVPEFRLDAAAGSGEVMVLGADGKGTTGRFKVSKMMNANVFGQMDEADRKFVDHAATATIAIEGETLKVAFDCPVPKGMVAKKVHEPWNGDRVEFNVHPQLGGRDEACFAANCGGPYAAHGYVNGTRNMGWSSKSKIVVDNRPEGFKVSMTIPVRDAFGKIPEPGDAFGVNFVRKGETCGSHSAWATVGGAFNAAGERYGTLVFGGTGPYFRRRLAAYENKCRQICGGLEQTALPSVNQVMDAVKAAVDAHGDDGAAFAALDRMFTELDQALIAIALGHTPLLIYDNVDVWGDEILPTIDSKMVAEISIKQPRNTRRVKAFALANLTGDEFLGNLKVCDRPGAIYNRTPDRERPKPGIQERFKLRRGVWMHRKNGTPCADPLVEFHLGSLVELGAGKAMSVYLEFDSKDMKPGEYKSTLSLVSATAGVPNVDIPVKVTITDDDLGAVYTVHHAETHIGNTFRNGHAPAKNCVKTFVARGYNVVQLSRFDGLYPVLDRNGVWQRPDYAEIDLYLDGWVEGGLRKDQMVVKPYIGPERDAPRHHGLWKGLCDYTGKRVPFASAEYERGARKMIEFFMAHMKERYGLRKDQVLWFPCDEPGGKIDDPEFKSPISRANWYAKLIKSIDPEYQTYICALATLTNTKEFQDRVEEFVPLFDNFEFYRPKISNAALKAIQRAKFRRVWSYHITTYEGTATAYRKGIWLNLRDGFEAESNYWHLDESAAFAGAGNGYGTFYIDRDLDLILLSRRQLANDMSFEEGKLVKYLRMKFAHDVAKRAKIEAIVKEAADHPSMANFDAALDKLLEML